jgi:hypothetical protein
VENESHPVNEWFREEEAIDNYVLNMKLTKPFIIRALEACATLVVDLIMIEKARKEEHPHWIGDNMENIIKRMMAVPGTARLKAELEQTIELEGLQKFSVHCTLYTDGSVMEERVFGNMQPQETLYTKGNSNNT